MDETSAIAADRCAQIAWLLAVKYFPDCSDARLHRQISDVMSWVSTRTWMYRQGPLLRAIAIVYLDPAPPQGRSPWDRSYALARLQLRDGRLCAIQLRGNTALAVDRLEQLGEWLAQHGESNIGLDALNASLSALACAGHDRPHGCAVEVTPSVSIAAVSKLRPLMIAKVTLGGLNRVRLGYGLRPLNRLPRLLSDHLESRLAHVDAIVRSYLMQLEQPALSLVDQFVTRNHCRHDDLGAYNFFVGASATASRNRMQAVRVLPWLLPLFAETGPTSSEATAVRQIREAIDDGWPLFEAVSFAFAVPCEVVRWTRGRMLPVVTFGGESRIGLVLALLSWLPRERRPTSDTAWYQLHDLVRALLSILSIGLPDRALPNALRTNSRYGKVMSHWLRELTRPDLTAGIAKLATMREREQDPTSIRDFIAALLGSMQRFCVDSSETVTRSGYTHLDALLDWMSTKPLHQLARCAVDWHAALDARAHREISSGERPEQPTVAWPPVLTTPLDIAPRVVFELADARSLIDEGLAMNHCVGSYAASCLYGDRIIVSLRDPDGRRLSTVELSIDISSLRVEVRQHKGRSNTVPPADCLYAVARLVNMLNSSLYRDRLAQRVAFCRRAPWMLTTPFLRHADLNGYQPIVEETAWFAAFGAIPADKSVDFPLPYPAGKSHRRH